MKLQGPAMRLTIFVGESDQWHHRPVYTETVHRTHAAGLAVVIVDEVDRIDAFLPQLDELITEGLIILDPVNVITYVGRAPQDAA